MEANNKLSVNKPRQTTKQTQLSQGYPVMKSQFAKKEIIVPSNTYTSKPANKLEELVVEIPHVQHEIEIKEILVPQITEKEINEYVYVEEPYDVPRNLPVPVKMTVAHEYTIPDLVARVKTIKFPVYVPKFVEVLVAVEIVPDKECEEIKKLHTRVSQLGTMTEAVSLGELESLAVEAKKVFIDKISSNIDLNEALQKAWLQGKLETNDVSS